MGMKPSVLLLTIGYAVGYGLMGLTGLPLLLALAFFTAVSYTHLSLPALAASGSVGRVRPKFAFTSCIAVSKGV